MTFHRFTALLLPVLASVALAAPVDLTRIGSGDRFVLMGSQRIHYRSDPDSNSVLILEGRVNASDLPAGVESSVTAEGVRLTFKWPYRLTLSPDERRLQIERVDTGFSALPELLRTDERAPMIFPLAHATPTLVAAQLVQLYPALKVITDDRQRSLMVIANAADRDLIAAVVQYLDSPRPQVSFEAEVLEINRSATQKLGIDYDFIFKLGLKELDIPSSPTDALFRLGRIARDTQQGLSLSATINLLQTSGAGRILARPRVVALDGTEARINATQNTPLAVTNNSLPTIQNISTGITLRMVPRVAPDGEVEVQVTIAVSAPTGVTSQGIPTFSSREATTVVRVRSGEPIVIGGLLESRRIEGANKVPLLGDIPVVGELFRSTTVNTSDTDLVIVITPRLLTRTGGG